MSAASTTGTDSELRRDREDFDRLWELDDEAPHGELDDEAPHEELDDEAPRGPPPAVPMDDEAPRGPPPAVPMDEAPRGPPPAVPMNRPRRRLPPPLPRRNEAGSRTGGRWVWREPIPGDEDRFEISDEDFKHQVVDTWSFSLPL